MTKVNTTQQASATPAKIFMPSQDQLAGTYRAQFDTAVKNHTAKTLTKAPAGAAKAKGINITPPRTLGSSQTAYVIKGHLYVKSAILSPTAKPSWTDCGMAPLF